MANPWLRLWTDMPTDPKWRSIARACKQSIALVQAVYLQVLVAASNAEERGRTQVNAEDVGSALDEHTETIQAVLDAMQGRVLDGDHVSGWEKRQPKREDSSANRAKEWRERNRTQPNATERPEKIREEEIREEKKEQKTSRGKRERKSAHPLYEQVKNLVFRYYRNHSGVDPEWDGAEGKALALLLAANPDAPREHWNACMVGRSNSDVNHADRPSKWLRSLSSYRKPLNEFNRPKENENGKIRQQGFKTRDDSNLDVLRECLGSAIHGPETAGDSGAAFYAGDGAADDAYAGSAGLVLDGVVGIRH